jgi:hypothetical protein
MPHKRIIKNKKVALPVLNPDAAGIDIGATEIYVAVPADRNPEPVRMFATFTQDLNELADWLQQCSIRTVAMESTGVYWIPLMQILEIRGLEVYLVNAKQSRMFQADVRTFPTVSGCNTCIRLDCCAPPSVRRRKSALSGP